MYKAAKNAIWIIVSKMVQSLLGLVVSMLTARYLGPANYGIINYAASIVAFATPLMQLGLNSILVQELLSNKDDMGEILGTALIMNVISGALCFIGVISFVAVANVGEKETMFVCALYSTQLFASAAENIVYWFQANLLSKYTSIVSLAAYVVVSAYRIFLLIEQKSIYWFAIAGSIEYLIIALSLIVFYFRLGGAAYRVSLDKARKLFNKGKYYILANLMVSVFAQTDKIMLKSMLGNAANGYYSAAVDCASKANFVFVAIIDSMRPVIFSSRLNQHESFELRVKQLYSIIIYLSTLQCVFFTLLATPIINIIYGSKYAQAIPVLRLVVWYTTFSYMGSVRNIWMLAENLQRLIWRINVFGALANVVMNFMLIPVIGIMGAALASLMTQFFTNFIVGYIIKPVRKNNALVIESLHPQYLKGTVSVLLAAIRSRKADK